MSKEYPEWKQIDPLRKFGERDPRPVFRTATGQKRRVPALPYHYWIKPSGHVVRIAMMTTRNLKGAAEGGGDVQRYYDFETRRQLRAGSIPWEYGHAKAKAPHLVGMMSQEQWEKWREEEKLRRQAEHDRKSSELRGTAYSTETERRILETQSAVKEVIQDLATQLRNQAGNGPKTSG